ncbi:class F sortase [Phytohabitans kaempferiae]|uniref:Class F sortase n=1 Tax=Phytohabitans kaempferiae TaxID=1620943 RepID=A0ABV6LZ13_9ACTN
MPDHEDGPWPSLERIFGAAAGMAAEIAKASVTSAPAAKPKALPKSPENQEVRAEGPRGLPGPAAQRAETPDSPPAAGTPEPTERPTSPGSLYAGATASPSAAGLVPGRPAGAGPRHAAPEEDGAPPDRPGIGPAPRHAVDPNAETGGEPSPDGEAAAAPDAEPAPGKELAPARGEVSDRETHGVEPAPDAAVPHDDPAPEDAVPAGYAHYVAAGLGGPLSRAARRVGGPDWGLRTVMATIIALMLLTVTGFGFERVTGVDVLPDGPAARFWPPPRDFPVLERSPPVNIRAKAVRISAEVHGVGTEPNGAIAVPTGDRFDEAGWYNQSPTPGEYGPAVIVGHVDNGEGPSVFNKLSRLRPGNRVEVTREDGTVAVFEVNSVKRFDRQHLPADEVFGDFSRPGLRLITCGGRWVGGTTGYADNVVVFAALVRSRGS